ncbi:hypothetical protein ACC794_37950, partial [Rhizobium ruizarguesonis]
MSNAQLRHDALGEELKAFFVVVLSAAALLSGISAEAPAIDSLGFAALVIFLRPSGFVVSPLPLCLS